MPNQMIEAARAKGATERLCRGELSAIGSNHELRVRVHMRWRRRPSPMLFYERG